MTKNEVRRLALRGTGRIDDAGRGARNGFAPMVIPGLRIVPMVMMPLGDCNLW